VLLQPYSELYLDRLEKTTAFGVNVEQMCSGNLSSFHRSALSPAHRGVLPPWGPGVSPQIFIYHRIINPVHPAHVSVPSVWGLMSKTLVQICSAKFEFRLTEKQRGHFPRPSVGSGGGRRGRAEAAERKQQLYGGSSSADLSRATAPRPSCQQRGGVSPWSG